MLIHDNTLNTLLLLSNTSVILLTANLEIVQEFVQFSRAFVINYVGSVYTCIDSNDVKLIQILHLCIRL